MKILRSPALDDVRVVWKQLVASMAVPVTPAERRARFRVAKFEVFEERTVLSAAGLLPLPTPEVIAEYVELAPQQDEQAFSIDSITLRINGTTEVTVGPQADPLALRAGDTLEVIGIDYVVSPFADGLGGVIAAEGYLHKLDETHGPGAVDYSDGRFGDPLNADPITAGSNRHDGLEGSWAVEEGWDRVSLVLIRYFGDSSERVANIGVQLQVETPDFKINKKSLDKLEKQTFRVGETAYMNIEWSNAGRGRYHNYLEVDVHHVDDLEQAAWVGVSVATLGRKESVSLLLENDHPNDAFSQFWTPQEAGQHRLLIAVDPEDAWQERREQDNRVELWVLVEEANSNETKGKGRGAKSQVDGRRVSHAGLLTPVPVTGDATAGSHAAGDVVTGTVAALPAGRHLAADAAASVDIVVETLARSEFATSTTSPVATSESGLLSERLATREPVELLVGRGGIAADGLVKANRSRLTGFNHAAEDELVKIDALLANDKPAPIAAPIAAFSVS